MNTKKPFKCRIGWHKWVNEIGPMGFPVFRQCQCCHKWQIGIGGTLKVDFVDPDTITAQVMQQRNKIFQHINTPV